MGIQMLYRRRADAILREDATFRKFVAWRLPAKNAFVYQEEGSIEEDLSRETDKSHLISRRTTTPRSKQ
jgi:hypothetical protein